METPRPYPGFRRRSAAPGRVAGSAFCLEPAEALPSGLPVRAVDGGGRADAPAGTPEPPGKAGRLNSIPLRDAEVLVTGGAGAVGGNLVALLVEAGNRVTVLDDLSSGFVENVPAGARFVRGDVADPAAVGEAFARRPSHVFHLAAQFANQNSVDHPVGDLMTNAAGTVRVLEAAVACSSRVVFSSSSCVYGSVAGVIHEELPFDLHTPYAISKAAAEEYCRFFARHHGLRVSLVRYFNGFGPGEHPGRYRNVIPNFFATAMAGEPLTVTGSGDETRCFCGFRGLARGTVLAATADVTPGDVFNIGSEREVRILDLAAAINRISGNAAGIRFVPRRDWDRVARRVPSIEKARRVLGFDPSPDDALEEGLLATWRWLRERREPVR